MRHGRHMYVRPRRGRRIAAFVAAVAGAAIVTVGGTELVRSVLGAGGSTALPPSTPSTGPRCASARAAGGAHLGTVAWVQGGALYLLDLDTCVERTLVQHGATPPVRFSHDGHWIAYGGGSIVSSSGGGEVQNPLPALSSWDWSPRSDLLAGTTPEGSVVLGGPERAARTLLPARTGAGHIAFSPNGRSLALDAGGDRVAVLDIASRSATTIYRVTPGTTAPPEVIGWSPDGRWVLFFSRFSGRAAVPLNAAPADGGPWVNVFDPVLPYGDFLSWCGDELVLSGGGKRSPSEGNQILVSGPPRWRFHNLSVDFSRSWIWPSCSSSGRWIATTVMPSAPENPPGQGPRSLWLLAADGSRRVRLTGATHAAFETPRWSANGRFLLVVRRPVTADAPGVLLLIPVDPSSGKPGSPVGPVATIGPSPGRSGHGDWSSMTDWYRPG